MVWVPRRVFSLKTSTAGAFAAPFRFSFARYNEQLILVIVIGPSGVQFRE